MYSRARTTMAERPIIFSGPMIRAILEGRKTQTRRVIEPQPATVEAVAGYSAFTPDGHISLRGPSGEEWFVKFKYRSGDVLWVREVWSHVKFECGDGAVKPGNFNPDYPWEIRYRADGGEPAGGRWRSPIHMPKWACRLRLRVLDVRVERVQEITPGDIVKEGAPREHSSDLITMVDKDRSWFKSGWDALNAKRGHGWDMNPWVWVIEFERAGKGQR
jgi:hypothetical protein